MCEVLYRRNCGRVAYPLMARIMHKIVVFHGQRNAKP